MNGARAADIIILSLLCVFAFADTMRVPFMWDDTIEVERNPVIRSGRISSIFTLSYWRSYRNDKSPVDVPLKPVSPVRSLSLLVDYKLWGLNAQGFHFTNMLLNAANVFIVYLLALLLLKDRFVALAAGILFCVHPMHVETVAWVKNRIDLFTSLFFLLSIYMYALWHNREKQAYLWASLGSFVLGLLSKETTIVLPLALALYVYCFMPAEKRKEGLKQTIPFWAITVIFLVFQKIIVQADRVAAGTAKLFAHLWQHVYIVFHSLGYYFYMLFNPLGLTSERYLPVPQSLADPLPLLSILAVAAYAALCVYLYRKDRKTAFFAAMIIIPLIPMSNIIYLSTRPIAEHRLYIPSFGFCVLAAMALSRMKALKPKVLLSSALVLITAGYSWATMNRVYEWRDPVAFWESTVKRSVPNYRAHFNLGCSYISAGRMEEAAKQIKLAESIAPDDPYVLNGMGVIFLDMQKYEDAAAFFEKTLLISPKFEYACANLGWAYYKLGHRKEALELLNRAKRLNPTLSLANIQLAEIYNKEGNIAEAEKEYRTALELEYYPWSAHKALIDMYEEHKMYDKAKTEYEKALKVDPANGWAYNGLGIIYVREGAYGKAEESFTRALEIYPSDQTIRKNMGELNRLLNDRKKAGYEM